MANLLENAFLLGLGAASLTAHKAQEFINDAIGNKTVTAEEGNQLLKTILAEGEKTQQALTDKVTEIIKSKGASLIPEDPRIAALEARVAELEKKLNETK